MNAPSPPQDKRSPPMPEKLADTAAMRLIAPLGRFLEIESASGILLVICTAVALGMANSPWADAWDHFWHTKVSLTVGPWQLSETLAHWVNDGLMTIFFFVVGLEIKRELVDGELRSLRKAALPIFGALGGMVVPAAIYLLVQGGREGHRGWGIPMATDIAFAVGILALLGSRVPLGLKIFLLALAIADDIGAILVIALFYSSDVALWPLAAAGGSLVLVAVMNRLGVRSIGLYVFVGVGIWLAMFHSGVHPTVAGVVLGLMTPGSAWLEGRLLVEVLMDALDRFDGKIEREHTHDHRELVGAVTRTATETVSPLERLETALHPWVAFGIMPIFALANAGVLIQPQAASHGIALAVAAGLVVGKPLGIMLFSWLAVRSGVAQLPAGVTWPAMLGAGCLGGIGFTMSLFIANLALSGTLLDAAKIGTLGGSAVSAILGLALLIAFLPKGDAATDS
jgi:NhaA family Na+:H+ antiporter